MGLWVSAEPPLDLRLSQRRSRCAKVGPHDLRNAHAPAVHGGPLPPAGGSRASLYLALSAHAPASSGESPGSHPLSQPSQSDGEVAQAELLAARRPGHSEETRVPAGRCGIL